VPLPRRHRPLPPRPQTPGAAPQAPRPSASATNYPAIPLYIPPAALIEMNPARRSKISDRMAGKYLPSPYFSRQNRLLPIEPTDPNHAQTNPKHHHQLLIRLLLLASPSRHCLLGTWNEQKSPACACGRERVPLFSQNICWRNGVRVECREPVAAQTTSPAGTSTSTTKPFSHLAASCHAYLLTDARVRHCARSSASRPTRRTRNWSMRCCSFQWQRERGITVPQTRATSIPSAIASCRSSQARPTRRASMSNEWRFCVRPMARWQSDFRLTSQ